MAGTGALKVVLALKEVRGDEKTNRLAASAQESLVVLKKELVDGVPSYWAINKRGVFGLVACDQVRVATSGTLCVALDDFAGGPNKIAFKKGERIEIVERVSAEWWHGVNTAGVEGRFPSELVDASDAIPPPIESDKGKGALELDAQVYAGRSKWEGTINMRSFETCRDAMHLALRAASVSDDRIDKVSRSPSCTKQTKLLCWHRLFALNFCLIKLAFFIIVCTVQFGT